VDNDEYINTVEPLIEKLNILNNQAIKLARGIISETLLDVDLYACSVLDKSIHLTDGFVEMIKSRNLSCAGILLRVQMDNCLRSYALIIAADRGEVVNKLISGEKLDTLKDKNGKKMKDFYLKNQLANIDERFETVYGNACGYIHFSDKAFFQSTQITGENSIMIQVSHEHPEKWNDYLIECILAYTHYLKLFYNLLSGMVQAKIEFEKTLKEVN